MLAKGWEDLLRVGLTSGLDFIVFIIVFLALGEDDEEACGSGGDNCGDGEGGSGVCVLVGFVEVGAVVFDDVVLLLNALR